jgi:hypothetical protein
VGLERGPLSLASTIEELLDRKSSGSCLESREYDQKDTSLWPRGTLYPQELALTSPTSGCLSVGTVRSRTQATEFFPVLLISLRLRKFPSGLSSFFREKRKLDRKGPIMGSVVGFFGNEGTFPSAYFTKFLHILSVILLRANVIASSSLLGESPKRKDKDVRYIYLVSELL